MLYESIAVSCLEGDWVKIFKKLIEIENGARHLKEHPTISYFAKFESYWLKRKGMVHF